MQKGFVFDVNKCTGCSACRIACRIENGLDAGIAWREVITFNPSHIPGIPGFHYSLACNHCVDPPCLTNCPACAYSKDAVTGAVILDGSVCIGCKYCSWACPFDAPKLNRSSGVMEKCTFCHERLMDGGEPACVSLCPTGALQLADTKPGAHRGVPGFPETDVKAAIEFIPLEGRRLVPETSLASTAGVDEVGFGAGREDPHKKITVRTEWTLVVFSQIAAWLTGYMVAVVLLGVHANALGFGVMGVLGMAVSALHLGKKERAARVVLNWRQSWFSREVILSLLFIGLGIVWLTAAPQNRGMGWVTALVGLAGLFAIDRVYHVTRTACLGWHSAQVLITGVYAAGLLGWSGMVILTAGGLKLLAYGVRKHRRHRTAGDDPRIGTSWLRIVLGFIVPMGTWMWFPDDRIIAAVISAAAGEMIDRCEFYAELDVPSPRRRMSEDLRAQITIRDPVRTRRAGSR